MSSTNIMHPLSATSQVADSYIAATSYPHSSLHLRPGPKFFHRFTASLLILLGLFGFIGSLILFSQHQPKPAAATLIESLLLITAGSVGWRMLSKSSSRWWRRAWMILVGLTAGLLVVLVILGAKGVKGDAQGAGKVGLIIDSVALAIVVVDIVFVVMAMWLPENNAGGEWHGEDVNS